jgi:hypothetical protein
LSTAINASVNAIISFIVACIQGVVDGILTFVGVSGLLAKNQFIERVWLLLTPAADHPEAEAYTSVGRM